MKEHFVDIVEDKVRDIAQEINELDTMVREYADDYSTFDYLFLCEVENLLEKANSLFLKCDELRPE